MSLVSSRILLEAMEQVSRRPAGQPAPPAPLPPASIRLLKILTALVLTVTCGGIAVRGRDDLAAWQELRVLDSLLRAIHHQQTRYFQASRSYAASLGTLNVAPPDGVEVLLLAGPMDGRPGFLAEACRDSRCRAITQEGRILERRSASSLPGEAGGGGSTVAARITASSSTEPASPPSADGHPAGSERTTIPAIPDRSGRSTPMTGKEGLEGADTPAPPPGKSVYVVPQAPPEAFGLEAGKPLPPLKPWRDTPALWGSLEEVRQ